MGPLFIKGVRGFRIGGYLNLDKDPDRVREARADRFMLDHLVSPSMRGSVVIVLLLCYWSALPSKSLTK